MGALLGLAVSPLLHSLATLVPWDGGTWSPSDFGLPVGVTVFLVVAMPVLVLAAAVLGLRRVVGNPIGAASSHTPKPLHAWRLLALPVAGALMAAGTPVRLLSRALRAEAALPALPALAATVGAGLVGMLVGLGLFSLIQEGREGVSAVLTPWLLAPVVLGLGVAVLAASVCTPALNRVRAEPLADE